MLLVWLLGSQAFGFPARNYNESMADEYMPIEKLEVTRRFETLCDQVWDCVSKWKPFERNTVGEQLVRASDSVAANIIEGGHREGDREGLRFLLLPERPPQRLPFSFGGLSPVGWSIRSKARNFLEIGLPQPSFSTISSAIDDPHLGR